MIPYMISYTEYVPEATIPSTKCDPRVFMFSTAGFSELHYTSWATLTTSRRLQSLKRMK
jgi:hypothetical protein